MDGVRYEQPSADYLNHRGLKRHAGAWDLWAMGVGAVISGDFFGWNFGLVAGGYGGMLAAVAVMTVLYLGLSFSLAELSPALPHTGGAYSFARTAMGPWAGYVTGLAENMEYILTPAVIVVGVGGYLGSIFGTADSLAPLWWLLCYAIFVGLNLVGVETSFKVSAAITLCALGVLLIFFVGAMPHFSPRQWAGPLFPKGARSVLEALPFALWLYLGIEQLPLAAEECHDAARDMPRGILSALGTLIVCSFLTVALNAGIAPGAAAVGASTEPLFLAFKTIFGSGVGTKVLALLACTGLLASFHAIIYAYGRQIYSLSRAGYFPTWLSVTHGTRKTPDRALIAGSALGFAVCLLIQFAGQKSPVGAILLNMAVFGAVLAYVLQMLAFVVLRRRFANLSRPYRSPLGETGAYFAIAISVATLAMLFINAEYRPGVIGAAIWLAAGLAYFALYARNRLVLSPEELFAVSARQESGS